MVKKRSNLLKWTSLLSWRNKKNKGSPGIYVPLYPGRHFLFPRLESVVTAYSKEKTILTVPTKQRNYSIDEITSEINFGGGVRVSVIASVSFDYHVSNPEEYCLSIKEGEENEYTERRLELEIIRRFEGACKGLGSYSSNNNNNSGTATNIKEDLVNRMNRSLSHRDDKLNKKNTGVILVANTKFNKFHLCIDPDECPGIIEMLSARRCREE